MTSVTSDTPDPIEQAVIDATNAYRVGMNLPPLKPRFLCRHCQSSFALEADYREHECESTDTDDSKHNDPRRGQAAAINRERKP